MMDKLVSVNITTYNRIDLLPRCLDSVLSQSYNNLEIIIVDDCSSDETQSLILEYQRNDDRIKYIRHKTNKGNAHARNTAFKKCNGYYVAFMDDDDEWIDDNKIQKQVEIFKNSNDDNLGIVCGGIARVDRNEKEILEYAYPPKNLILKVLSGGLIHNSTAMLKREVIEKANAFNINLPRGVDSDFFRRVIVKHGYNVEFMLDITVRYYENISIRMTDSKSVNSLKKDIISNELCLQNFKSEFQEYRLAKMIRKQRYIRTYIKLLILEFNLINLKNLLKYMIK